MRTAERAGARPGLREGFSTGTAATGAALAALEFLLDGHAPARVRVPLPPFAPGAGPDSHAGAMPRAWHELGVAECGPGLAQELGAPHRACASPVREIEAHGPAAGGRPARPEGVRSAHARIIKDGGDDPDVTHGAAITASVLFGAPLFPTGAQWTDAATAQAPASILSAPVHGLPPVRLMGGPGVGRVTLPGLPVPVGMAAINPVPQAQIRFALGRRLAAVNNADALPRSVTVILSVPGGEALARRTLNPRLGIVGGISILGTQGTVRPYSHDAWEAAVVQAVSVAGAAGCRTLCLSTGRRSERLLMARYPTLPPLAFVQAADFVATSLAAAGRLALDRLVWGSFFGKFVKLAQGAASTHARHTGLDMAALAAHCHAAHAACAASVAGCTTAAHALELILADAHAQDVLARIGALAADTARRFAGRPVTLHLFHHDGRELFSL